MTSDNGFRYISYQKALRSGHVIIYWNLKKTIWKGVHTINCDLFKQYIFQMTDHVSGRQRLCIQTHVSENRILHEGTCHSSCQEFQNDIMQMVRIELWEPVLYPLKKWKMWINNREAKVSAICRIIFGIWYYYLRQDEYVLSVLVNNFDELFIG